MSQDGLTTYRIRRCQTEGTVGWRESHKGRFLYWYEVGSDTKLAKSLEAFDSCNTVLSIGQKVMNHGEPAGSS